MTKAQKRQCARYRTDIVGNKLTVARATRFNRFVTRLRQLFRLLVGAFTPARS